MEPSVRKKSMERRYDMTKPLSEYSKDEMVALLKSDVKEWNRLREEEPDFKPNLRQTRFDIALRVGSSVYDNIVENLKSVNLYRANLAYATLEGASLKRANLRRANLYGANLGRADLAFANLV
jgi:Na+/phosphate symporter